MFLDPHSYQKYATTQKQIATDLVTFFPPPNQAKNIIDIGSGTGFVANLLRNQSQNINILCLDSSPQMVKFLLHSNQKVILHDINNPINLPIKFDEAFSCMCLQWVKNIDITIKNVKSCLKTNGNFFCAIPLDGSLAEICDQFIKNNIPTPIIQFYKSQNFIHQKTYIQYGDISTILKSFNKVGAKNPIYNYKITKTDLKKLQTNFCNYATWKIGFFCF